MLNEDRKARVNRTGSCETQAPSRDAILHRMRRRRRKTRQRGRTCSCSGAVRHAYAAGQDQAA